MINEPVLYNTSIPEHIRTHRMTCVAAVILLLMLALLAGCEAADTGSTIDDTGDDIADNISGAESTGRVLRLLTHDSFAMSDAALAEFEAQAGVTLEVIRGGDAGRMVNQAILTSDTPLADVVYGIDNAFLGRAVGNDIFVPYQSPLLDTVDESFVDASLPVTPIDSGDVCLNYDIAYFEDNELAVPQSLDDLLLPQYRDLLVVENPTTSSPGLAFMLVTIDVYGSEADVTTDTTDTTDTASDASSDGIDDYIGYWQALVANGARIVDSWEAAYFTHFTAASESGTYPLVVSYSSSPPFTIDETSGQPATASIVADGTCFRQIEYAGVLRNGSNDEAARQFIDFMLGRTFQADLPQQMFVFPVVTGVDLPESFVQAADRPVNPVQIDPVVLEASRDEWLQRWTENVAG